MPEQRSSNTARLVAPIALAVFAVAFFGVLFTSGSGEDSGGGEPAAERTSTQPRERDAPREPGRGAASYTVKTGDTLAGIAEKTNVPVERLQELNPDLDPQALVSGQKIKLRE